MLLEVLKALGLDVPAQINALKSDIDQRVQSATSQVSQVAQQAALLAFLYAFAAGAALLAIGVALFALFWWVSDYYGVYAGLGVVFLLLALAALIPARMALGRSKSFAVDTGKTPIALPGQRGAVGLSSAGAVSPAPAAPPAPQNSPTAANPSAGDLVEPIVALLTGARGRGSIAAELLAGLGEGGGPVNMALDRATNVIRAGDRTNLLTVLGSAAVLGFLFTRSRRPKR
jgi:hypothetical protein